VILAGKPKHLLRPRPENPGELAAWYREALAAQESSGHNVSEFAEAIGVSAATLYLWRRRFAGSLPVPTTSRGLLEVQVGPGVDARRELFTVRLVDGNEIVVPAAFDADALRRILEVLQPC
jgi:transposase-like protein